MTDQTTLPIRPAPLREVLDAGGNPRMILGELGFAQLIDGIIENSAGVSPASRLHHADRWDSWIDASCRGERLPAWGDDTLDPFDQEQVREESWRCEVLRDLTLLDRLLAFATETERRAWRDEADCIARPHPLVVSPPPADRESCCDGCGAPLAKGVPRLSIGGRSYRDSRGEEQVYSDAPEAGPWCAGCVRDALREMERMED